MRNEELRTLYQETLEDLRRSPERLMQFLRQNSFLHAMSFEDIILVHGQNPRASLLKKWEEWQELNTVPLRGTVAIQTLNEFNNRYSKRISYYDVTQLAHPKVDLDEILLSSEELSAYLDRLSFEKNESQTILENYFAYLQETSRQVLSSYSALSEAEKSIVPYLAYYNLAVTYNLIAEEEQQEISQVVFKQLQGSDIRFERVIRVGNNLSMRQSEYIIAHYSELKEEAVQLEEESLLSEMQEVIESGEVENTTDNTETEVVEVEREVMEIAKIISSEAEFHEAMIKAYQALYASYMHQQELKLKGHNVSGAYDTYDIMTSKGSVQFVYNYIGRELGTDDDSKVVFSIGTHNDMFETEPMSTPIRSKVFNVFGQGLKDLSFAHQEPQVAHEKEKSVANELQVEQIIQDETDAKDVSRVLSFLEIAQEIYAYGHDKTSSEILPDVQERYEGAFSTLKNGMPGSLGDKYKEWISNVVPYDEPQQEYYRYAPHRVIDYLKDDFAFTHDDALKIFASLSLPNAPRSALLGEFAQRLDKQLILNTSQSETSESSQVSRSVKKSHEALLNAAISVFNLNEEFKVINAGGGSFSLVKASFGGILNETIVNSYEGEFEVLNSTADTLTGIENFEDKFNSFLHENAGNTPVSEREEEKEAISETLPSLIDEGLTSEFEAFTNKKIGEMETSSSVSATISQNKVDELHDFEFPEDLTDFYPRTPFDKVEANIKAIRLIKTLEVNHRRANSEEQIILAQYVGWGGLANDFFDENRQKFSTQREALKSFVTVEEYRSMKESSLTAYYTDPEIVRAMFTDLEARGFKGGRILDPAMGTGNFFSSMPKHLRENSELYGVELDSVTGAIAKQLHPNAHIQIKGFETTDFNASSFDVVIGNVPFSDFSIKDSAYSRSYRIHDYFFKKSLDLTRQGGLVSFITSTGTMDKKNSSFRKEMKEVSGLVGSVRLPNTAFKKIAGTAVSTDILTLQRGQGQNLDESWVETTVPRDTNQNLLNGTQANVVFENSSSRLIIGDYKVNNYRGQTLVVQENSTLNLIEEIKGNFEEQEAQTSYVPYFYSDNAEKRSELVSNAIVQSDKLFEIPEAVKNLAPQTHVVFEGKVYFNDMAEGIIEKNKAWFDNGFVHDEDEDGKLKFDKQGQPVLKNVRGSFDGKTLARLKGMTEISQKVQAIVDYQLNEPEVLGEDARFEQLLQELNQTYDRFVNDKNLKLKGGNVLNARKNATLFNDDLNFYRMLAIENEVHNKDGKITYEKGDFFFKKTITPPAELPVIETVQDALNLSISQYGRVNLEFMSEQLNLEVDEVIEQLDEEIYLNPESNEYEPASHYLSGNIYHKLEIIDKKISEGNTSYSRQKEALERVIPKRLSLHEIDFKIGSRWIPIESYNEFLAEALNNGYGSKMKVEYNNINATYNISNATAKNRVPSYMTTSLYKSLIIKGQERHHNPVHILEDMLNLKNTKITQQVEKEGGGTKSVVNPELTVVASEKQVLLQEAFRKWILANSEWVETLEEIYNRTYNSTVERKYDGSNLSFGSLTESIELRPHQQNAVARVVQEGRGLFAHVVGSGKTLSMIATGMKLKEMGRAKKPLYVVPKAVLNQFAADILRAYPDKNITVPSERDFTRANRKRFMAKVQTGDFDAVVLSNEQFGRIPLSAERQEESLQEEINVILEARIVAKADEKGRTTVKQLLQLEKKAKERLEKLQTKKDESPIIFEATGIDYLFLDEAHNFKNLSYTTNISDVKGISSTASQRASDLLGKVRFLQELHDGGGVIFATGTPVSNSMAEIYTMMKYLEPDVLEDHQIRNFDEWVSVFARIHTKMEVDQTGQKWKPVSRLELQNVPELMTLFRNVADIQTAEMLNLPTPELANNGKPFVHSSELTPAQKDYMEELIYRSEHMPNDPSLDNMLKLTTDARLMATDMRLIDEYFDAEDSQKGQQVAETVHKIWIENMDNKATQLIFSDIGTPKGERKDKGASLTSDDVDYKFSIYQDIKDKLVELGIPKEEIAFIHDAKTDKKKEELFEKVRQGKIRILFASTAKGGTGVNIQDKLLAVHHVDVPWRPSDIEQRNGRVLRQGNTNSEVQIHHYVTKGTFDTFMWQIQEQKLKFITQVMSGKSASRSMDDLDELVLTASEIKAVTTNNPHIREKMDLENQLAGLTILRHSFQSDQAADKKEMERLEKNLPLMEEYLENALVDSILAKQFQSQNSEEFFLKLKEHLFTDKEKAGSYLTNLAYHAKEQETIGQFGGFDILVKPNLNTDLMAAPLIHLVGKNTYSKELNASSGIGSIQRLQTLVSRQIAKTAEKQQQGVENAKEMIQYLVEKINLPFEKEEEFIQVSRRLAVVNTEIELAVAREDTPRDVTSAIEERDFEEDYEL
jgi:N12 class adenine-specific DNA methylase